MIRIGSWSSGWPDGVRLADFDVLDSTNEEARRLALGGECGPLWILTREQTAGRGRRGRTWFSPPGSGLYISTIVRRASIAPWLTLAGGVAVAEGVRTATGLPVQIKWPNDVVIDSGLGKRRKLAGILTEASTSADGLQFAVIGIGINLSPSAYPPDIADRATSIAAELGRPIDAADILIECLAALDARITQLASGHASAVLARWLELSPSAVGARVECEGAIAGVTAGIADDGALLVRTPRGVAAIRSGQVSWL